MDPEQIHTSPMEGNWKFQVVKRDLKSPFFLNEKYIYKAKLEFPEGCMSTPYNLLPRGCTPQVVYSQFQVTGMIKLGQTNPPKIPGQDQKLTPKKSHAKFSNLKSFQKALNDVTQKIKTLETASLCLFIHHTI